MKLKVKSFTGNGSYVIDTVRKTCTCPSKKHCKHLDEFGVYEDKKWYQSNTPTYSQALSGLVKSLRIRNEEQVCYWLAYLHRENHRTPDKGYAFRTARRLLIGSAEDGHSIAVMERVADNFGGICSTTTPLEHLLAEGLRICRVPNWWHPITNGPSYIYDGMLSYRAVCVYHQYKGETADNIFCWLREAIECEDTVMAFTMLEAAYDNNYTDSTKMANMLMKFAIDTQCPEAMRLLTIHLRHKGALSKDANFLFQAIWWMCGNKSVVKDDLAKVFKSEVMEAKAKALGQLKENLVIPGWCCDGVHCSGTDRRFAGMWPDMYAVCQAYDNYQRIDPSDKWLPDFYCYDGLDYE